MFYFYIGILLISLATTEGFITKGNFSNTSPLELNRQRENLVTGTKLTKTLAGYTPSESRALLRCTWYCRDLPLCNSFEIEFNSTLASFACYFFSHDLCDNYSNTTLIESPGFKVYDIRPGDVADRSKTCTRKCIDENSCGFCNYGASCTGELCQDCVRTCWDIIPNIKGHHLVYIYKPTYIVLQCLDSYLKFFYKGKFTYTKELEGLHLSCKLQLYYGPGIKVRSFYKNCSVTNSTLSIGLLGSYDQSAGNYWNAPFQNRPLLVPTNTNCKPFFYESDPCPTTNMVPGGGEGYYFPTSNAALDAMPIKYLTVLIKKA